MRTNRRIIGVYMDKMINILVEEITNFWKELKTYVKDKIKKVVCKCKCTKTD